MTRSEIADRLDVANTTVHANLNRLLAEPRRIRVSGWKRTGGRAFRQFSLGTGADAPFHTLRSIVKPRVDMTEINCRLLVDALARPQTADELAESCRCSAAYVRKYLTLLMAEAPRRIHVKEWRRPDGPGGLSKVFAAGEKRDAKRPKLTQADRFQEQKADIDKHQRALALRRLAAARRRTRKKPQNVFSALGL